MTTPTSIRVPTGFHGQFRTDLPARAAYSEGAGPYRIVPAAAAIPQHHEDLATLAKYAGDHGFSLIPRGAGSGMPGGNVGTGIVVDLQRFDGPLHVSDRRTANVGAAVTAAQVNAAASRLKLRLPPDPSSSAFCTVGGMVSTNAAGPRSVRFGPMRRWVRGVEVVTADGERGWIGRTGTRRSARTPTERQRRDLQPQLSAITRFRAEGHQAILAHSALIESRYPRTTKNTAGYALDAYLETEDLLDLLIGSEGTLGFITRAELALDVLPAAVSTVLLGLQSAEALPDVVAALLALEPAAVEYVDRAYLALSPPPDLPLDGIDGILLVEFERGTADGARGVAGDAVRDTRPWCAYVKTGLTEPERDALWSIRHEASSALARLPAPKRSLQVIEDGCVPVPRLADYLTGVRRAAAEAGLDVVAFGHVGDGHLHVNVLADATDPELGGRLATLLDATTELIVAARGTPSGEHGDGRLRGPLLERIYGSEVVALFQLVKRAFDPRATLNRGVVVPASDEPPLTALKVGEGAAAIPPHVAAGLLAMERAGAWHRPKLELADG